MFIVKIVESTSYRFIDLYVPPNIYGNFITRLAYIHFYRTIGDGNVFIERSK
jgi:hypothetical protein